MPSGVTEDNHSSSFRVVFTQSERSNTKINHFILSCQPHSCDTRTLVIGRGTTTPDLLVREAHPNEWRRCEWRIWPEPERTICPMEAGRDARRTGDLKVVLLKILCLGSINRRGRCVLARRSRDLHAQLPSQSLDLVRMGLFEALRNDPPSESSGLAVHEVKTRKTIQNRSFR